jgi:nucleoside-diphosphate-sugar epimerase
METIRLGLTGSSGVLGRSLGRFRFLSSGASIEWVPFQGRLERADDCAAFVREFESLDGVFHLAAKVPVGDVERDPLGSIEVNVNATVRLLEGLRASERKPWFFLGSSSHVYASSDRPLNEDSPYDPHTRYGLTKLQADLWSSFYRKHYGLPICIGRIFSFSHPNQASSYFIPSMIRKIREAPKGATLEIPGLHGSRDFLDADTIAEGILSLYEKRITETLNIGAGAGIPLDDVVSVLLRLLGRTDLSVIKLPQGTSHLVADTTRLRSHGILLPFQLEKFLQKMCEGVDTK